MWPHDKLSRGQRAERQGQYCQPEAGLIFKGAGDGHADKGGKEEKRQTMIYCGLRERNMYTRTRTEARNERDRKEAGEEGKAGGNRWLRCCG